MAKSTWILHLSDLHFTERTDPMTWLAPLRDDIQDPKGGHNCSGLDYVIVSGDLTEQATKEQFNQAFSFLADLCEHFKVPRDCCIVVPGNHDVSWADNALEDGSGDAGQAPRAALAQHGSHSIPESEEYAARFLNFERALRNFRGEELPETREQLHDLVTAGKHLVTLSCDETKLEFLGLNSAWQSTRQRPQDASINEKALTEGLNRLGTTQQNLRIAVWHHPITGNEKIANDGFLSQLQKRGFKLCLHGHVHELRTDVIRYYDPEHKIYCIGAGAFGAPAGSRPEGERNLYNLIEVSANHQSVRVHSRARDAHGGSWGALAIWPTDEPSKKQTYLDLRIGRERWVKRWSVSLLTIALGLLLAAMTYSFLLYRESESLRKQVVSVDLFDPNPVFPGFGAAIVLENNIDASLKWQKAPCKGRCIGGAKNSLEIVSDIRRQGFGVMLLKKTRHMSCADLTDATIVIRAEIKTEPQRFEVGLRDDETTTLFFDCAANTKAGEEEDFAISLRDIAPQAREFHADRVCQFSLGFATGAGAAQGRHEMRLLGIGLETTPTQGGGCRLRGGRDGR